MRGMKATNVSTVILPFVLFSLASLPSDSCPFSLVLPCREADCASTEEQGRRAGEKSSAPAPGAGVVHQAGRIGKGG